MKFIKIFIISIFLLVFYVILAGHGLTLGVLLIDFICKYITDWSGCNITEFGDYSGDLFFILPAILFFWIYAGFIIHWNYKQLPMSEMQKIFTMLFFALITYPFLYLAGNGLYERFISFGSANFTHSFLIGTFFSIIIWIFLVFVYFFIQNKKK